MPLGWKWLDDKWLALASEDIRGARGQLGLSQESAASRAGVTVDFYRSLEENTIKTLAGC